MLIYETETWIIYSSNFIREILILCSEKSFLECLEQAKCFLGRRKKKVRRWIEFFFGQREKEMKKKQVHWQRWNTYKNAWREFKFKFMLFGLLSRD